MNQDIKHVNNDEIDLIELIFSIWRKKWWVIIITALFTGCALLYALTTKEQWTSKTEIIAPNIKDMKDYLDISERYYTITNLNKIQSLDQRQNQDHSTKSSEVLLNAFSSAIGSNEKQISFLQHSDYMKKKLASDGDNKPNILHYLNAIQVKKPNKNDKNDKNNGIDFIKVSLSSENAADAQDLLVNLIDYVNENVRQVMTEDLKTEIETKIKTLTIQKESIKVYTDTVQQVRLKNLQKALLTAKKAGIYEYALSNRNDQSSTAYLSGDAAIELKDNRLAEDNFLFLLGEKYLSAQIDTLANSAAVYPEKYYQAELQVSLLSDLFEQQHSRAFDTFHYQSAPSLPLHRDKPKRSLIVLIGAFLGGVIGVVFALFLVGVENYKKRLKN